MTRAARTVKAAACATMVAALGLSGIYSASAYSASGEAKSVMSKLAPAGFSDTLIASDGSRHPAYAAIAAWLGAYGLRDAYEAGDLPVFVAPEIAGNTALGLYAQWGSEPGGILILNTAGPWALAHEVGHYLASKNETFVKFGARAALGAQGERIADCTAMILLAGSSAARKDTADCTFDELATATTIIKGDPLPLLTATQLATSTAEVVATGGTYTAARDTTDLGLTERTPSLDDLLADRAEAGVTPRTGPAVGPLGTPTSLITLAAARATGEEEGWLDTVGVEVIAVPNLRAITGVDLLEVGGAILVGEPHLIVANPSRAIAKLIAARVPGLSQCFVPVLMEVVQGYVDGPQYGLWSAVQAGDLHLDCTRADLLQDAALYAASGLAPTATPNTDATQANASGLTPARIVDTPSDPDPDRIATQSDFDEARSAAGLPNPWDGWW